MPTAHPRNIWKSSATLLLTIATVLLFTDANIVVNLHNGTQIEMEAYQIFYRGSPTQPLTEPLTSNVTTDPRLSDRHFLLFYQDTPLERLIVEAQQIGCVGVIYASSVNVVGGNLKYRTDDSYIASQVNITVVEVGFVQLGAGLGSELLKSLAAQELISNVTILPDEAENPWVPVISSGWIYVWSISIILFSAANIVLASLQLKKFYAFYGGCTQAIAIYVLIIEIISNTIRILACIDFFGSNYLYPEWLYVFLGELCIPFVIASFLLFTLYWHELMTSASVIVHPFIVKMKIPFFVISGFILAVQLIKTIVRSATLFAGFNLIIAAFYLASFLFIVIFYTITGIKLLKRMHKSKSLGRTTVKLTKSTIKVLISGGIIFIFVVLAILFATGIPFTPIGYVVTWYITYAVVNIASLMNILAFELPSRSSSSSQGTGSLKQTNSVVLEPSSILNPSSAS